jgi:hypothetical protein
MNRIGPVNVRIELVERYPCNTKQELLDRENWWIQQLQPTLNVNKPGAIQRAGGLLAYMRNRVRCGCGATVTRSNTGHHKRTAKHIAAMAAIDIDQLFFIDMFA